MVSLFHNERNIKKMNVYSKSATTCIAENDLESAITRYNTTTQRWKDHWWDTIVEIYDSCKSWAKVYVLDRINKIVCECATQIKRVFKENKPSWCYWIEIFEDGNLIYNKIGTTQEKDPTTRFKQIIKKGWTGVYGSLDYRIKRIYNLGDIPPEGLESELRAKLIKKYKGANYIKNDRFAITDVKDEPTYEEMDSWALDYGATIFA